MAGADVRFHPGATEDYLQAIGFYADRQAGIALRFELEVAAPIDRIVESPRRWRAVDATHRRLPLRRFPFAVIYREHDGRLWIVAIAHGNRRPGYWRGRRLER